ncbi:DMT family transporter [Alphaproteobacteria bacterium]|nr:DMT family transporter [Alphaproteobacteria bacterium]
MANSQNLLPQGIHRKWQGLSGNVQGAFWMILSALLFTSMGGLIKHLGQRLDPIEVVFFRSLFGVIWLLPLIYKAGGLKTLKTNHPAMQFSRALLGAIAMVFMFYGLTMIPLADSQAIIFSRPLWMIPLAVIFLAEVVRWRRWTATMVGFCGVLVMVRPGDTMQIGALLVAGNAICAAAGFTLIKIMTQKEEEGLTILCWHTMLTTLLSAIPLYFVWISPTLTELLLLIIMGAGLTFAHSCIIRALECGEATAVLPFDYSRLIFAMVIGYFFFTETVDAWTVCGAAIIILASHYILRRESALEATDTRESTSP